MKILDIISDAMKELGLNYSFMEWNDVPIYSYFTGEYQETEPHTEDGLRETTFILTGFSRSSYFELERAKELISDYFSPITGRATMADDGSAIVVFYAGALMIPTEDAELKKIQINLSVKEWKVM